MFYIWSLLRVLQIVCLWENIKYWCIIGCWQFVVVIVVLQWINEERIHGRGERYYVNQITG